MAPRLRLFLVVLGACAVVARRDRARGRLGRRPLVGHERLGLRGRAAAGRRSRRPTSRCATRTARRVSLRRPAGRAGGRRLHVLDLQGHLPAAGPADPAAPCATCAPPPPAVAVSVDPANDTPERAERFLVRQHVTGRIRFLLGTPRAARADLARVRRSSHRARASSTRPAWCSSTATGRQCVGFPHRPAHARGPRPRHRRAARQARRSAVDTLVARVGFSDGSCRCRHHHRARPPRRLSDPVAARSTGGRSSTSTRPPPRRSPRR